MAPPLAGSCRPCWVGRLFPRAGSASADARHRGGGGKGRRDRRSNQSERERLLDLYRQCLGVVTGAEWTATLH